MSGGMTKQAGDLTAPGNIPSTLLSGLSTGSSPMPEHNQSVIGDPAVVGSAGIEPLVKPPTGDLLKEDVGGKGITEMSATELLSTATSTIQEAAGVTAQTATDLANKAFETVMGSK